MKWFQKSLLIALLAGSLIGCSRVDLSDLATGAGAVAGAGLGALTGNASIVLATTSVGAVAGAVAVEDAAKPENFCKVNPDQCQEFLFWSSVKDAIHWIIGAVVALIVIAWWTPGPQSIFRKRSKTPQEPR